MPPQPPSPRLWNSCLGDCSVSATLGQGHLDLRESPADDLMTQMISIGQAGVSCFESSRGWASLRPSCVQHRRAFKGEREWLKMWCLCNLCAYSLKKYSVWFKGVQSSMWWHLNKTEEKCHRWGRAGVCVTELTQPVYAVPECVCLSHVYITLCG